jgi:hypothetical protein
MFINTLTTDFDFNTFNKIIGVFTSFVGLGAVDNEWDRRAWNIASYTYTTGAAGAISCAGSVCEAKVHFVDKITVSGDGAGNSSAVSGSTVEGLFDGFHGKVGVASVDNFEESNLWVTGQVNILCAISD